MVRMGLAAYLQMQERHHMGEHLLHSSRLWRCFRIKLRSRQYPIAGLELLDGLIAIRRQERRPGTEAEPGISPALTQPLPST